MVVAHRGVYCLQEVSSWPDGEEFNHKDWMVIHTAGSPSAILVPKEWWDQIIWTGSYCMHAVVTINKVGIVSSYLPDV